jgi:phage FluMu protein Com
MSEKIKPCHCGYEGELMGIQHTGFLSLICPRCDRTVDAFTTKGLAEAWNKPAPTSPQQPGAEGA